MTQKHYFNRIRSMYYFLEIAQWLISTDISDQVEAITIM